MGKKQKKKLCVLSSTFLSDPPKVPKLCKNTKICIKCKNMHTNGKMDIGEEVTLLKNVIWFHQLFCQTLLTCPNGAKTTKICIKVQNYA